VAFRDLLRERVIAAATRPCQEYDPEFAYCFHNPEALVGRILTAVEDRLIPPPAPWTSPSRFVLSQLLMARALLTHRAGTPGPVRWGQVNRLRLVQTVPLPPGADLDLELAGCPESVCVAQEDFGASVRLVVRLGRSFRATVSIPGSQSADADTNNRALLDWASGHTVPLR
jgi:penicillin G amidase